MFDVCALSRAALALAFGALTATAAQANDSLFVGDGLDNNVKAFNAATGAFQRSLPTGTAPVVGPRGILFRSNSLFLVNQNVNTPFNGEVLKFNAVTGALLGAVVAGTRSDAPFAPRGAILWRNNLFVADVYPGDPSLPGQVGKYTAAGAFVKALVQAKNQPAFHPFGVVIGPDALLYVSSQPNLFTSGLGGQVLQFNPTTGKFVKSFIYNDPARIDGGCTDALTGPEGLVFGPDGRLYVASKRPSELATDKIVIFEGPGGAHPGRCVGKIDLDEPSEIGKVPKPRSIAVALLFGPGGDLFVPITNAFPEGPPPAQDPGKGRGTVRRYQIGCTPTATRRCFSNFVRLPDSLGHPLGQGWYLTFGKTQPGTLTYIN